jgi:hypothetical protein
MQDTSPSKLSVNRLEAINQDTIDNLLRRIRCQTNDLRIVIASLCDRPIAVDCPSSPGGTRGR